MTKIEQNKKGCKPEPGYCCNVPCEPNGLSCEAAITKEFRKRLSKQPRQDVPLTQEGVGDADSYDKKCSEKEHGLGELPSRILQL